MTESSEEFLRRIGIKSRAMADQKWMALEPKVADMMRIWMDIRLSKMRGDGPTILSQEDGNLVAHALSLLCYEITERRNVAAEE